MAQSLEVAALVRQAEALALHVFVVSWARGSGEASGGKRRRLWRR